MRLRRLNSWMAVTIASRFVFALVNRIASARSLSGILTVVFMIPFYRHQYSLSMTTGILWAARGFAGSFCKPARKFDHFLDAAAVVIQCVVAPVGVQRSCLFTDTTLKVPRVLHTLGSCGV